jgi:hypothetical protein
MWKHEYVLKKKKTQVELKTTIFADILGNPKYLAITGGFRQTSRDIEPTIVELKEDMRILSAMGIKIIRTYNVHLKKLQMFGS